MSAPDDDFVYRYSRVDLLNEYADAVLGERAHGYGIRPRVAGSALSAIEQAKDLLGDGASRDDLRTAVRLLRGVRARLAVELGDGEDDS